MSKNATKPNIYNQLRDKAEAQLKTGTTTATSHWSMGVDALRLLHKLSSNPANAEDALKLLHELQVHQVELDLQHEEIVAHEQVLVEDLDLYQALYESAPFGYLLVDFEGFIIQGNLAAAEFLGVDQDDLGGQRIDACVTPTNRPLLLELLRRVAQTGTRDSCVAETAGGENTSRQRLFLASRSPGEQNLLVACCDYPSAE